MTSFVFMSMIGQEGSLDTHNNQAILTSFVFMSMIGQEDSVDTHIIIRPY